LWQTKAVLSTSSLKKKRNLKIKPGIDSTISESMKTKCMAGLALNRCINHFYFRNSTIEAVDNVEEVADHRIYKSWSSIYATLLSTYLFSF
jgi:hypothetical protein